MDKIKVKIINNSKYPNPKYATPYSAGMDLYSNLDEPITLKPLERKLIPTGIKIGLPIGYEAQIRPRSGMAIKYGVSVCNTPGTIDADYVGEICVILINLSNTDFTVNPGERIAQMVVAKHETIDWECVDMLDDTERGEQGFGHTGNK